MAQRKLQGEIDRTLKKVTEGVELFESIFEKIQTTQIQTQKEKFEQDLKTQIKKLQRLRDQIKQWLASNDIKDKQPLLDNRRLIETQMERFKACEKEMKTKAFSKEGLNAAARLDPKEKEKVELQQWLSNMVDELARQVEASEAEVEQLSGVRKKKDSDKAARLEELEHLNERRNWHVSRLELILRLLENGNLSTDAVSDIKDDIAYFVESNTEEDFDEDEGIYDELNLSEEEEMFGPTNDDHQSSHDSVSVADEPAPRTPAKDAKAHDVERSPAAAKPAVPTTTTAPAKQVPQRKPTLDSTTSRPSLVTGVSSATSAATTSASRSASNPAPAPASSAAASAPARPTPAPLPPIRYAAAAAGAGAAAVPTPSATSSSSVPQVTSPPPPPSASASAQQTMSPTPASASAARAIPPMSSPEVTSASAPSQILDSLQAGQPSPRSLQNLASTSPVTSTASINGFTSALSNGAFSQASATSPTPASQQAPGGQRDEAATSPKPTASSGSAATATSTTSNGMALPSSLMDLGASFESAKQKSLLRRDGLGDLSSIGKALDASYTNAPQPVDVEKPSYYVPKNAYQTPSYYPHEPSAQFANPALFAKFDVDTLFYIFYYCQGTYLQYLAAQELKKQSWRFHKQYLTWFQRASEPTQITDEYEQGVYLYFDWEGSWCQRKKENFVFSYKWLE